MMVPGAMAATWRIMVVVGKSATSEAKAIPSVDIASELAGCPNCQVHTLDSPSLAALHAALHDFQPNLLYLWAGSTGEPDPMVSNLQHLVLEGEDQLLPEDVPELVAGRNIQAVVFNMNPEAIPFAEVRQHVPHVVKWSPEHDVSALNAATFGICLVSFLRQPCTTFTEAFAMANHILRAHACADTGAKRDPVFPILDSDETPDLPGTKPPPIPHVEGVDLSLGFSRSIAGWEDTRLLSPVAEVTMYLVSTQSILDTERLAALGLALRALLAMEARQARLVASFPLNYMPQHVVPGTNVGRVVVETASSVQFPAVIGAPAQVMQMPGLLEAAMQATLSCDALTLRFQLPPHGSPAPDIIEDPSIAFGLKVTPVLLITSVWVVNVLRSLALRGHRLLPLLGIGAVSSQPVQGFTPEDIMRFQMLQSQQPILNQIPQLAYTRFNQLNGPPAPAWDMNVDVPVRTKGDKGWKSKVDRGATLRETKFDELTANAAPVEQWQSGRLPLPQCTQQAFLDDLLAFLSERFGWTMDRAEFPNAVLNGGPLDLFNLYREVVARGGFKMGNAINWKGEIFTKMSNWTAEHKMTGVGNALKRHYQKLLWEYERANQRDLGGDKCMLCQGGPEMGMDWVACNLCHRWQHIACDPRTDLGDIKEYADAGKTFDCVDCSKIKADQTKTAV